MNNSFDDDMRSLSADVGMKESAVKKRPTATSECSTMSKHPRRPTNENEDEFFYEIGVFFDGETKVSARDRASTPPDMEPGSFHPANKL